MKIIMFEWDIAKGKKLNGKNLMIGQHLPNQETKHSVSKEIYGISIDLVDDSKKNKLKRFSCSDKYITGKPAEISKKEARTLLIKEIDKALDLMFDNQHIANTNRDLNICNLEEDKDETEFVL
ncbi:hypothetical protein [Aestuariibaculum lutulentum]|uniref:Uncharacterized protein n=1 Tax=Aestuariibaculum lutulentum TaxID=2920935 RepID=A0ABS9RLV2_9FLAO|nr:hypothetical protein [Aestuariibaculum lutulentum]MCH4553092.1 hypothetical protein [Aestuariibaculum lutulentum]